MSMLASIMAVPLLVNRIEWRDAWASGAAIIDLPRTPVKRKRIRQGMAV
jgi:hypothetical protein